jgi:uncharacterized membrane protein YqhA
MLRRLLASTRYAVIIAVVSTLVGSVALLVYEALVVFTAIHSAFSAPEISATYAKVFAVGLIEAVDVFLIAIAVYMISLGLYALFVDNSLPLPRWLEVHDLEDLKNNLVSIVIAVLAVLFLREAVSWDGEQDLLGFGAALALVIAALTFFLVKKRVPRE